MKILHCADIHLDSPGKLLDAERAKKRKHELINAFEKMAEHADTVGVCAAIIAGDLFDRSKTAASTRKTVLGIISRYPGIQWYYLKGNHDKNDFLADTDDIPSNLHTFGDCWCSYSISDNVTISGMEVTEAGLTELYTGPALDFNKFNIVTLHGQESESGGRNNTQIINLRQLSHKGIDYLALGHIHSYKFEKFDPRGYYCYPGCLESRGFDECGDHGYVILDIDEDSRRFEHSLHSHPIRSAFIREVDITGLMNSHDIVNKISSDISTYGIPKSDMLEVVLTGEVDYECEKNIEYISDMFEDEFYVFKVKDKTRFKVDFEKFRVDRSLKGEFVRTVESAMDLSEEEKAEIIRYGIMVMKGEEVLPC